MMKWLVNATVKQYLLRLRMRRIERYMLQPEAAQERWFRWLKPIVLPGLWLQRLTTREPDRDQCEVALRALSACLEPAELAALTPAVEPDFSPPPLHYEEDELESGDDEDTRPRREVNAE